MKSLKLNDFYDFSNLACDQKANFNIQSTQNRDQNSKLSVEENLLKDGNRTLNNNEFNNDDKSKIPMFSSLSPQQIGNGFKNNMQVLQPSPSMQLLGHIFQALTQSNNISTQLPDELTEAKEKKSWCFCQSCGEYRDEVGMNKTSSCCCCCCFCFKKDATKNCLNDETTTSQNELIILHQQQDILQQQLQEIMQQYQKKMNIDVSSIDRECYNCSETTDSDDCDYDELINSLENVLEKHKNKKLMKQKCKIKSTSVKRKLKTERKLNREIKYTKKTESKTKLSENSKKSTHRKLVNLKKSKVSNVAITESQSGLENESYSTLKDNQSRVTNVSRLPIAENHSNLSIKDESRILIKDQKRMSIEDQSRMSIRNQSRMLMENQSRMSIEDQSRMLLENQSRMSIEDQIKMSIEDQIKMSTEDQIKMSLEDQSKKSTHSVKKDLQTEKVLDKEKHSAEKLEEKTRRKAKKKLVKHSDKKKNKKEAESCRKSRVKFCDFDYTDQNDCDCDSHNGKDMMCDCGCNCGCKCGGSYGCDKKKSKWLKS